jgi:DNA ligase-1
MSFFDLPARRHLVHKPVEFRNLCAEAKKRIESVCTDKWLWQIKYDGCMGIVLKRGDSAQMYSREGNNVLSCAHILQELIDKDYPDGAYFGEVWSAGMEFKDISGMYRRQYSDDRSKSQLVYKLFDYVPMREFMCGVDNVCYGARWMRLSNAHSVRNHTGDNKVQLAHTFVYSDAALEESDNGIKQLREWGHVFGTDGYVAKAYGGDWTAGDGKKGQTIKVKDHISVDLRCRGVVEGEGKFTGMVGALLVEWRGQVVTVSGGKLTNDERRKYFNPQDLYALGGIRGQIVEVHALGLTPDGQLREPRFQRIRHDKTEPSE